jgi:hypothetical protein
MTDGLADPVGVIVAMVGGVEPALELAVIEDVVISVAGGRAKRRKLAQALAGRPAILTDGRSPAPRAAGDLLVALRKAGAGIISPPACAGCGRQLRSFQRRGEDWFCSACGPKREPCAGCGTSGSSTSATGTAGPGARSARQTGTRWPS